MRVVTNFMALEHRSRRWYGLLLGLLLFVFLDLVTGTLIFRLGSEKINNRLYRQISPIYHHDLKPNTAAWARWGPNRYRIYTNSLGFKDAAVRDVPLVSNARRVVLLGDSFTEGVGYAYEDTFAGILHARLAPRGIDVLNAGVASYAPVIYYRKMKYLIEEARLDVGEVIVFLDISGIGDEAWFYDLDRDDKVVDQPFQAGTSIDPSVMRGMPPSRWENFNVWVREHVLSVMVVGRLRKRFQRHELTSGPLGPWQAKLASKRGNWTFAFDAAAFKAVGERGLQRASHSMNLLRDLLRKHGIPLTVVVYPWPNQIVASDLNSKQVQYWRAWTAANGSGFADLFGEFIDGSDPAVTLRKYYVEGDVHFNAAGHQRLAAAMLEKITWAPAHQVPVPSRGY